MVGKVLSIEVGQSFTRAIEVDYKSTKRPRIYKYFSFLTPEGTVTDGVVNEDHMEEFVKILQAEMKENHISTTKTVFTINSGSIASREVSIPLVKENRIQSVLTANSAEYFPVDLARYQLVYRQIEKDEENKKLKLLVYAVPRRMVESYYTLAKACGLSIQALDYVGNSIFQVMQRTMSPQAAVTIKVEETSSMITILRDGKIDLQRNVSYGIDEIVECVNESGYFGDDLSYEEIIEALGREICVHKTLAGVTDSEKNELIRQGRDEKLLELRDNATDAFRYLIGNLNRALDYYTSKHGDFEMKEITLLGVGAFCRGVDILLANEMGTKVTTVTAFADARPSGKSGARDFRSAEFMACIGAAIDPLQIQMEATKAGGGEDSSSESMLVPNLVFAVGFAVAVLLVASSLIYNFILHTQQNKLNNRLVELQPAQEAYEAYLLAQADYTDCLTMDAMADTPNDILLDFLDELEDNAPTNISLDNLTAGTTGVTLTLEADKKEEIAALIVKLREFDSIASVETNGFSEEVEDSGAVKIECTITCTYAIKDETPDTEESINEAEDTDVTEDTDTTESVDSEDGTEAE